MADPINLQRILVIDDEYLIRWSLSQALTQQGHQVLSAENGKEAIEILKTHAFDFIITALLMPEADGWKVLEVSRQSRPQPRVIIISAHGVEGTEDMAREKGAWAYLEKPYVFGKIKDLMK